MADWCDMDPDERGFVLAHLQYLNLLAQRGTQRLLLELRAMLEEVGDELIEVVESAAAELEDEEPEDADADDEEFAAVEEPMPQPPLAAVPDLEPAPVAEVVDLVAADQDGDEPPEQEGA